MCDCHLSNLKHFLYSPFWISWTSTATSGDGWATPTPWIGWLRWSLGILVTTCCWIGPLTWVKVHISVIITVLILVIITIYVHEQNHADKSQTYEPFLHAREFHDLFVSFFFSFQLAASHVKGVYIYIFWIWVTLRSWMGYLFDFILFQFMPIRFLLYH